MDETSRPHATPSAEPEPKSWLARYGRWLVLALILGMLIAVFASGGGQGLRTWIGDNWAAIQSWVKDHFALAVLLYFLIYVIVTGFSIPIGNVLSIGAGVVFGRWVGLAVVSFGSTAGATLAMLGSRYLFRDAVRRKLGARFEKINANIAREGAFYLFTLRLMIVVPFWMINLAMGLTTMRVWTFWWVSQLGMLAGTFLYINAGAEARNISTVGDIFSVPIIASFALLGVAPLLLRWGVLWLRGGKQP